MPGTSAPTTVFSIDCPNCGGTTSHEPVFDCPDCGEPIEPDIKLARNVSYCVAAKALTTWKPDKQITLHIRHGKWALCGAGSYTVPVSREFATHHDVRLCKSCEIQR